MNYEQKYKEALERARIWKEKSGMPKYKQGILDVIFPELSETEDERIKKEITELVMCPTWKTEKEFHRRKELVAWLEKQGNIDKASYEIAEKEKYDFVSGQFIECRKSFNEFKEDNSYWFEYVGNDTYIGRSDNILNKKFHITPRQLYRLFTQQHRPKENNVVSEETNPPIAYGKYVDGCLNEAAKHFFSEGEDKYFVADLFYAGVRCGQSWLEKQREQDYQTITDIATFIINYQGYIKDRAKWLDCLGVKFNLVEKQSEQKSFDYENCTIAQKDFALKDSHEYVEIGGVKWATMNVGAEKITDSGLYFAWGETQGYTAAQVLSKKTFRLRNYKYAYSRPNKCMTKYNNTDGKTVLDASDDAVTAAWGYNWRMPTKEEIQALFNATTSQWVENYIGSGVSGRLFTDKTDSSKTLFFPASGYCVDDNVCDVGSNGYYWSRSFYTNDVDHAWDLYFNNGGVYPVNISSRYHGCSVRGVMNC